MTDYAIDDILGPPEGLYLRTYDQNKRYHSKIAVHLQSCGV